MAEFNLLKKTADERRSELYGLAPYLVYKVGDRTYNYGAKAAADLFYTGALKDVNPTEILAIGAGVTSLIGCFMNNNSIIRVHADNWDTSNITSLYVCFWRASSIKELQIRAWDLSKVTTMNSAFRGMTSLEKIILPGIPVTVSSADKLFDGDTNLSYIRFAGEIQRAIDFSSCPLTAESVIDILEHLADTPDEGATITFKAGIYAGFTSAEREVIDALVIEVVANGWTIVNMSAA